MGCPSFSCKLLYCMSLFDNLGLKAGLVLTNGALAEI